jgi:RimK family alpha-L-glutamate ligase
VSLLVSGIERTRQLVVNPSVAAHRLCTRKAEQAAIFAKAMVPTPATIVGSLELVAKEGAAKLGFPLIVKMSVGSFGRCVWKCDDQAELDTLVSTRQSSDKKNRRYVVQEFIENSGDYRLLVLGSRVLGAIKRTAVSSDEFRNNVALGGEAVAFDPPQSWCDLAVRAAHACGVLVGGVDIMARNGSEPLVIEVNIQPQYKGLQAATGIDVAAAMIKYVANIRCLSCGADYHVFPGTGGPTHRLASAAQEYDELDEATARVQLMPALPTVTPRQGQQRRMKMRRKGGES